MSSSLLHRSPDNTCWMVAIPFQTAILRRRPRAPAESPLSSGAYPETVSSLLRPSYHTYLNTPFSRLGFPCTIIFYDRHDFPSHVSLIRKSASHPTPFNESARAASRFRYTPFSRNLRRPPRTRAKEDIQKKQKRFLGLGWRCD
jgi:hypothetical protein